jgi:hypothetical protein
MSNEGENCRRNSRKSLLDESNAGMDDMNGMVVGELNEDMNMDMGMNMGMMDTSNWNNYENKKKYSFRGGLAMLFLWLVILFILGLIILYFSRPTYVLKPNSLEIDWGKASLASLVFALVGVIIIWLVMSCIR